MLALYQDNDIEKPITPYVGMVIGETTGRELGKWVNAVLFNTTPRKYSRNVYSSARHIAWKCTGPSCNWSLDVRRSKEKGWVVVSHVGEHINCVSMGVPKSTHIARVVADSIHPNTKFKDVDKILRDKGIILSDSNVQRTYRAMTMVKAEARDPFIDGFVYLNSYLNNLIDNNPNSQVRFECTTGKDGQMHFHRMFMMLGAMVQVALNCKPVLSLDACFLQATEWGSYQALVAGTSDGDNRDVLVAFAVVPAESAADYIWFVKNMKQAVQLSAWLNENGLVLITDRGKGLKKATAIEFPNACMRHCARHLLGNVPGQSFEGSSALSYYWSAVYAYDKRGFDAAMEALNLIRPEAFTYLSKIDPKLWTNYAFPTYTWDLSTNNLAERQINWIGGDVRQETPVKMLKSIIMRLMNRYFELQKTDEARINKGCIITRYAEDYINEELKQADYYGVHVQNHSVDARHSTYIVIRKSKYGSSSGAQDDGKKVTRYINGMYQCSCHRPTPMSCRHILAVVCFLGNAESIYDEANIENHIPYCFRMEALTRAYSCPISPCTDAMLVKSAVLPPVVDNKSTGSKEKKRIRSKQQRHTGDKSGVKPYFCGNCGQPGHRRDTCRFHAMTPEERKLLQKQVLQSLEELNVRQPATVVVSTPLSSCDEHQLILSLRGDRMRNCIESNVLRELQETAFRDEDEARSETPRDAEQEEAGEESHTAANLLTSSYAQVEEVDDVHDVDEDDLYKSCMSSDASTASSSFTTPVAAPKLSTMDSLTQLTSDCADSIADLEVGWEETSLHTPPIAAEELPLAACACGEPDEVEDMVQCPKCEKWMHFSCGQYNPMKRMKNWSCSACKVGNPQARKRAKSAKK